ncbi:glycosyltransferase family 4 protein [bacterium]|nr:glycosyltransferase family 4 protein [bacterium]MBU1957269.1 glycosyltransferase family 4 protein [bacterium]
MRKTIWFFNDYAGSKYHGMEFRNYYVARELLKLGHKVIIVSASYMHLFKKLPKIDGEYTFENIDGIEYIWIDVPHYTTSTDKKRVWKWFVFVKKLYGLPVDKMGKPDYVIASPMAPFLIKPAYHFAKKFNAKLIYEVKDIWPLSLMELGGYSKHHPFIFLMQKFANYAYEKSDLTITVLSNAFNYMQKHGLVAEKFKYIPNGISLEDMEENKKLNSITLASLPKESFLVGYTGTIGIANALDSFVESAEYLKDYPSIKLLLIGEGKEKIKLKSIVLEKQLTNVCFIDEIPKNEVQSLLCFLDVCYIGLQKKLIFEYGVSPNKLFDYLYASKPILYGVNDKKSIVEKSQSGVTVFSDNPKSIADGIIKLYKLNEEERTQMGKNGKKYVLKHHTYENIAKEFIKTLEEL